MAGLSFIHAGFLAAGAALAIPVLIHLLFRQRARQMPIGSVRFLRQVVREHQRRRRLRQWLLLALRALAVLLLALLFARPFLDQSAQHASQQELVLLIDRSASMSTTDAGGTTALQRAVRAAEQQLADLDENVVVHVALCDEAEVHEIRPLELSPTSKASDAATDYGLALDWARDALALSGRKDQRVVLYTDLQRSGVKDVLSDPLPDRVVLEFVDVGKPVSQNVAIQAVEAVNREIRPDDPVTLRIQLVNFGAVPVAKVPVKIRLRGESGEVNAERAVDLPGGGEVVVDVPLDIDKDGVYQGEVTIEANDDAAWDNRRWTALEARHPDRLLLVDGQAGHSVFSSETYYLETALRLRTQETASKVRSFEVERIVWESGEGFPDLAGFRAIVLANVRRLSAADVRRLTEYVQQGGNLWIFAGDQVDVESLDELRDAGVFPGTVARIPDAGAAQVTQWDPDHPALQPFSDAQRGNLRQWEFSTTLPLDKLAPETRVLLRSAKAVLGAERKAGRGRCLYLGCTADREWTVWPQSRLYVPVVRQFAAYLTDQLSEQATVVNQFVERPQQRAGIESVAGRVVVSNVDPRESVPDRVTTDEMFQSMGAVAPELTLEQRVERADIALPPGNLRPEELWTTFAWVLFVVLLAETILATRVHS